MEEEVSVREVAIQHTEICLKLQIINIKNKNVYVWWSLFPLQAAESQCSTPDFSSFLLLNGYTQLNLSMCQESQGKENAKESRYKQNWFIQQDENVMHQQARCNSATHP